MVAKFLNGIVCYYISKAEIIDNDFHSKWSCTAITADDSSTKLKSAILNMLTSLSIEISGGNNIENCKDDLLQITLNLKSENFKRLNISITEKRKTIK